MVSARSATSERGAWSLRFWVGFVVCALVLLVLVPVLNRAVGRASPVALPDYLVPLLGKYLCYAILALSLDLVWGYAGILSLGHGAFFALGGYCMGMYLMRQIGTRGVYGNPQLPDFMVFLNWSELPWFWWGFDHFAYAAAMVMLVPGVFALVFGWLAFSAIRRPGPNCSSSPYRRCSPALPARFTCRRSASSIRANSRRAIRSRSRSGCRSAGAAR